MKLLVPEKIQNMGLPTKTANRAEVDAFNTMCAGLYDLQDMEPYIAKRLALIPN